MLRMPKGCVPACVTLTQPAALNSPAQILTDTAPEKQQKKQLLYPNRPKSRHYCIPTNAQIVTGTPHAVSSLKKPKSIKMKLVKEEGFWFVFFFSFANILCL